MTTMIFKPSKKKRAYLKLACKAYHHVYAWTVVQLQAMQARGVAITDDIDDKVLLKFNSIASKEYPWLKAVDTSVIEYAIQTACEEWSAFQQGVEEYGKDWSHYEDYYPTPPIQEHFFYTECNHIHGEHVYINGNITGIHVGVTDIKQGDILQIEQEIDDIDSNSWSICKFAQL